MDFSALCSGGAWQQLRSWLSGVTPREPAPRPDRVILLVEPDFKARTSLAETLRSAGYKTLAASTGAEAVRIGVTQPRRIDLLITDVALPDFWGWELLEVMRLDRPDLRGLYLASKLDADSLHIEPDAEIPLPAAELMRRVHQALQPPDSFRAAGRGAVRPFRAFSILRAASGAAKRIA